MKHNILATIGITIVAFFSFTITAIAQRKVKLVTGEQSLDVSGSEISVKKIRENAAFGGKYYYIATFEKIPGREVLQNISIHAKLANLTYLVSSGELPNQLFVTRNRVVATSILNPLAKLNPLLANGNFTRLAHADGKLDLAVAVFPGISMAAIKTALQADGFIIETSALEKNNILKLQIYTKQLDRLSAYPFIAYIQPLLTDKILNERSRFMAGAFGLNASTANGGYSLNGKGVVVGVGDDADPSLHPDLQDRIINRTPGIVNNHGAHVSGTIAGAGLLQPDRRGFASEATLLNQYFSNIWLNAATYVQDFGMVLTNNSYGAQVGDCRYYGVYDLFSGVLDNQATELPQLLHVFAAGNSGDDACSPFAQHYGTVLGSYQSAKNVISVGRTDYPQQASGSSSSGPVKDGRLKPEITALGIVESCDGGSDYWGAYGTSMSAPGITGSLALLYERYRQLNSGKNPDGALMKAILLNGARDVGTKGPDYRHGYGFVNLPNSIRMLNNRQYLLGSIAQNGSKDSVIQVSAGTAALKIMLYWHDVAASPLAIKTLVNDLDLEVIRPDGSSVVYPAILDPANPVAAATQGADHCNNSEQVVIETPVAGNYTIRIKGYEVQGNQPFVVAFDAVPAGINLRSPVKGDSWSSGLQNQFGLTGIFISWDDEGTGSGTYTLQYSTNNGATWNTILNDLGDNNRYYVWQPPAETATNTALVRIAKNNGFAADTTGVFQILERPNYSLASNPCPGYLTVNWAPAPGADDYEVIIKKGPVMASVAVVKPPTLSYTISGLNPDSVYYVAVRARKNGIPGRYLQSYGRQPNSGNCAGNISDGDLQLDSITSPIFGRDFTSNSLGANESITVRIKNLDNVAVAAGTYNVKVSVDGGPFATQAGTTAIGAMGSALQTINGFNLSAKGVHSIVAVVENVGLKDAVAANDSFRVSVQNLPNQAISLAGPLLETFESAPTFNIQRTTYGLPGLNRWDYFNSDQYARARSFVNTGIAKSGTKAITLDVSKATPYVKNPANNLQATINLSGYTTNDEVRLDFQFKQHGSAQLANPQNKVWVRGADNQNWIPVYDLSANQAEPGVWKGSGSIELNDILLAANPVQQFTSSLQVRFGQYALYGMADNLIAAGYSFDDIRLYIATNDMQILSIDTPAIYSCGLNTAVPVKITLRNSTNQPMSNVPVSFSINGGTAVNETITTAIPPNGIFTYQFNTLANLAGNTLLTIEASVNYPGDNVSENNKISSTINNPPVISKFPYLEDFESGKGNYFTTGQNISWQYGQPSSVKISTAASGSKAWKTTLTGNYNDRENSQLNSPCFNISTLKNPMLSFSMAYDIEDCSPYGVTCDVAWVEYSTNGINWQKLGKAGEGTNWYDAANVNAFMRRNKTYWHAATFALPKNVSELRLRFVFVSDEATNYEGLAIDDIHIYDLPAPMYNSPGTGNTITRLVAGNDPIDFKDGGKLVATILPNNNNLGNTEVKTYIFAGAVRNNSQQYYGARNITIKPGNTINGSATVRFYFTDKEADSLRLAASCSSCTNPADYTKIGVTQYSDADRTKEDGDIANNNNGISRYIHGNELRLVPFDSGYYAEFNVTTFSEFWLNDGKGINLPLPGRWLSFNAVKQPNSVVKLTWSTINEIDIDKYVVEVANSRQAVTSNQFTAIGETAAKNTSFADYVYFDNRTEKTGEYYYRVKQLDRNGRSFYSPVVLVRFTIKPFEIQVFPNPVKDKLLLTVETNENKQLQFILFNTAGQKLYSQSFSATAGVSQLPVYLNRPGISTGVYTLAVTDGKSWWYHKIVKQ